MKKNKKWWSIIATTTLLLLLVVGAYGYTIYNSFTDTIEAMQEPISREKSEKRLDKPALEKVDPFSVLILGVDEREGDKGRSDTIIVLTVNKKQNSIKMLSIPRDTRTEIIGHGSTDKINHAYAFGGTDMSIATVENLLNIPIDYFVKVNMEGFKELVDAVGGITVQNQMNFVSDGNTFKKGALKLTGDEALAYVRMRKQDAKGDFGRQQRQRQIIQGIISKGTSLSSIAKYETILEALGNNIKTNINLDEMIEIQKNYIEVGRNIEQLQLKGSGKIIDGIYYLIMTDEEKQRIQNLLKEHLEL